MIGDMAMKTETTNYCKQIVKQFSRTLSGNCPELTREVLSHALTNILAAQRFILPVGGRLHDDKEFRALDETEELRLPYPIITLEYRHEHSENIQPGHSESLKRVIIVREIDRGIVFMPICFFEGMWAPLPEMMFPSTMYLNRDAPLVDGRVLIRIGSSNINYMMSGGFEFSDYADEAGVILCFLNTLSCSNVAVERKTRITGSSIKNKNKNDRLSNDYHILTIKSLRYSDHSEHSVGYRNSPREHLRRGHIRRLEDGRRIWVNAAIVSPGHQQKVSKDYRISC